MVGESGSNLYAYKPFKPGEKYITITFFLTNYFRSWFHVLGDTYLYMYIYKLNKCSINVHPSIKSSASAIDQISRPIVEGDDFIKAIIRGT